MRIAALLPALLAAARAFADETPELNVVTTFPDNPFSLVQNGRSNRVVFSIANAPGSDRALVLEEVTGAFLNPNKQNGQRGRVLRNMTTTKIKSAPIAKVGDQPLQMPFDFYPEFRPQPLHVEFRFKVLDQNASKRYNIAAYTGTVTVEEPKQSPLFDLQLLSVYAILALVLAGTLMYVYDRYLASHLRPKSQQKHTQTKLVSGSPPEADEWLPKPNVRARKQVPRKK